MQETHNASAMYSMPGPQGETEINLKNLMQMAQALNTQRKFGLRLSCLKYEILTIGRFLLANRGKEHLNWVYAQLNDESGEIRAQWAKLR